MNKMSDNQIFESFISQFTDFGNKNSEVNSLDMRYVFDLQKQRLAENNLKLKYTFQNSNFQNASAPSGWSNDEYQNIVVYRSFEIIKEFFVNRSRKFRKKRKEIFYAVVTHMNNEQSEKTACCPNCGAIHSIKTLLHEGCPNCRTRFMMSDIFPKVTNHFSVKDYSENPKSLASSIKWYVLGGVLAGITINLISTFINGISPEILAGDKALVELILGCVGASAAGAFFGYIGWCISKVGSIFIDAAKAVPKLAIQYDAQNKIPEFMSRFDPKFSYQYFVGKAIALMKIMIFSSDYSNLAIYEGKETQNKYKDIVDVQFNGAMRLNGYRQSGPYVYLDVTVYTINTYFVKNKIQEKKEKFRMVLCKNAMTPPDYGFSLKKVACRSCGGSFDATRERKCPYCGNNYRLGEDDWVVLVFEKE